VARRLILAEPDPSWPAVFAREAQTVRAALAGIAVEVHHIGSTSVPGLLAKPIVDLMPVVADLRDVDACRPACEAAGFTWRGEHGLAGRRYLVRYAADGEDHLVHVHVLVSGHHEISRHLAFRDALRARPELVTAYAAVKRGLAAVSTDKTAYQDGKSTFIEGVLREVMGAGYLPPIE
jgi:GrpB-like predicted nucleotidyltransferase (UPF0157 family)